MFYYIYILNEGGGVGIRPSPLLLCFFAQGLSLYPPLPLNHAPCVYLIESWKVLAYFSSLLFFQLLYCLFPNFYHISFLSLLLTTRKWWWQYNSPALALSTNNYQWKYYYYSYYYPYLFLQFYTNYIIFSQSYSLFLSLFNILFCDSENKHYE